MKSSSGSGFRKRHVLFPVAILLFLCVGGVVFLLLWQGPTLPPTVSIQQPESDRLAEVNQILPVLISADYDRGISRVELYADGALVGSQDTSLPGGDNPLLMSQAWMPLTTGRHLLMARAYDLKHKFYDSSVVFIDVVEALSDTATINTHDIPLGEGAQLPSLNDIASASGASLDTLHNLNPGLADIADDAPLPDGASLTVPYTPPPAPSDTPELPVPLPGSPTSPQIVSATASDCTTVQLSWNDVSDETGYTVYRLMNGDAMFTAVAHLGANTSSYTDTISHYGDYLYQVAADKGTLESLSNVASARTPDNCEPPAPVGTTNLTISFLSLITSQRFDGIYCYSSLDGSPFRRIPRHDFQVMEPEADGLTYNLQTQLANFGQLVLPAQPTSSSVALTLECWGRLGAESTPLGTIQSSRGSSEWDGRDLAENAEAVLLHYRIDQDPHTTRPVSVDLIPGISGQPLDLPSGFHRYPDPLMPVPTNVRDIRPMVGICNVLQRWGITTTPCTAMRWHEWDGIAWDWSASGRYTESGLNGYRIKVNQLDMQDPHHLVLTTLTEFMVYGGHSKSAPPPAILNNVGCGTSVQISVRAESLIGTESEYSDPLVITAPPCTGNNLITITVQQIIVGDGSHDSVTDNDPCVFCTDRRLELWGLFYAGRTLTFRPDPTTHNGPEFGGCPDRTQCATGGLYTFQDPDPNHSLIWNDRYTIWAPGPGRTLPFVVDLYDYDYWTFLTSFSPGAPLPHFGRGDWCHATMTLDGRSAVEWERFDQTFHLRARNPQANCDITIRVQGGSR